MGTVPRRVVVIGGMDIEGADIAHPARDVVMEEMPRGTSSGESTPRRRDRALIDRDVSDS